MFIPLFEMFFRVHTEKAVVRKRAPIAKRCPQHNNLLPKEEFSKARQPATTFLSDTNFLRGEGVSNATLLKNNSRKLNDPLEKQAGFLLWGGGGGCRTFFLYYYYFSKPQK